MTLQIMQPLRALPQWQLHRAARPANNSRLKVRLQHSNQPTRTPAPDPIEVLRARARSSGSGVPRPTSLARRIVSTVFYASLFGVIGFGTAWAFKTFQYLRMGDWIVQPSTRQRNKEWFGTQMDSSSLVQSLRRDGWVEESPKRQALHVEDNIPKLVDAARGQHLVNEKLDNGYLAVRHFRHPKDSMTVLVFMADFGCESWPHTLHGGIATTVIQEALDTHVKNFPDYAPIRNRETTMNYRVPLNPGIMYSVLIRTDGTEHPYGTASAPDKSFMGVAVNVLLNQMDRAPRYVEKYDEATKSSQRICDIHDAQKGVSAFVRGGSILFLASKQYREKVGQNQQMIPALQDRLDYWLKSYTSGKTGLKK